MCTSTVQASARLPPLPLLSLNHPVHMPCFSPSLTVCCCFLISVSFTNGIGPCTGYVGSSSSLSFSTFSRVSKDSFHLALISTSSVRIVPLLSFLFFSLYLSLSCLRQFVDNFLPFYRIELVIAIFARTLRCFGYFPLGSFVRLSELLFVFMTSGLLVLFELQSLFFHSYLHFLIPLQCFFLVVGSFSHSLS